MRKVEGGLAALATWVDQSPTKNFIIGDSLTLADIAAGSVLGYMAVRWSDHPWITQYPGLKRYWEGLDARESFKTGDSLYARYPTHHHTHIYPYLHLHDILPHILHRPIVLVLPESSQQYIPSTTSKNYRYSPSHAPNNTHPQTTQPPHKPKKPNSSPSHPASASPEKTRKHTQ